VIRVDQHFRCMGGDARVRLESSRHSRRDLEREAARVRATLREADRALTRFDPASELCALNRDPRSGVPASPLVIELVRAAAWAGARSDGLVDATLIGPIEAAGYTQSRTGAMPAPLDAALAAAPPRRPARAASHWAWADLAVDAAGRVIRPPGVHVDSGGIGKGLAVDIAAARLPAGVRYAIGCGGDLAVGGTHTWPWQVAVDDARSGAEIHRLHVHAGGVATSGINARIWQRADGGYAHHLIDPSTGQPAWTGLVAATAVAPTALGAEVLAKTALLSGPRSARRVLNLGGGVLQHDDGRVEVIDAAPVVRLPSGQRWHAA
jgi:thiamine biosynthesis lipoprotein